MRQPVTNTYLNVISSDHESESQNSIPHLADVSTSRIWRQSSEELFDERMEENIIFVTAACNLHPMWAANISWAQTINAGYLQKNLGAREKSLCE